MKKISLLLAFLGLIGMQVVLAQTRDISGTVTSADDGSSIPGASVVVKGTTLGTVTDMDGKFVLKVAQGAKVLTVSFVGMTTAEVPITGSSSYAIKLESENVAVSEVVVTALGIKRSEKSIGYSASTVNSAEINAAKSSSLITGLQGKVAGLTISSAGGTGTSQKVYIRGVSSFTGSNQPLYVVNGVPMSNSFAGKDGTSNSVDFGNQANDINPDDVQSVTVLKGASATALYGSRAANGVIMITTKRGVGDGKISVVYSGSVTASEVMRTPQTQKNFGQGWPAWDPAENGSWGPKLDGRTNVWGAYSTPNYGPGLTPPSFYPGFKVMSKPFSYVEDNMRNFYETGMEYQNNISISGGDERNSFAMSYGNTYSDGVVPTNADLYKRNIFSFRGDHKSGKFSASFDVSYVRKDIKAISSGQGSDGATLFQELSQMPVDIPLTQLKDFNSMYHNVDNFFTLYASNPYWVIANNGNTYQDDRIYGKIELGYDLFAHTKLMGRVGGDFTNSRQRSFNAVAKITPGTWNYKNKADKVGTYDEYNSYNGQIDASGLISGDYKLSEDFKLNVVAGINYNTRNSYSSDAYLYGLAVPNWYSLTNGTDKPVTTSYTSKRILIGALGQFDVSYKEWAFGTLSLRNDWSSTLPKGKNSYFYAGVNGAILLTDAVPTLKGNILNYAKLRAAWGQTGNDAPVYRTFGNNVPTNIGLGFGGVVMPINGVSGITLSNVNGNINLKPEITTDIEFGADLKFFGNRVGLDVAYYMKSTKDQIISSSVAPETQYTAFTRNVGQVDNKGFEARLLLVPVKTKDFEWEVVTTFSKNRSEVVKLWDDVKEYRITGAYGVDFVAIVGQPLGVFKVPQAALSPDGKVIVSSTGRPTVDAVNKKIVGSREPDFILGMNNRFTYKGVSLSAVLDYRQGGKFWSNTAEMLAFDGNSPITVFNDRQPFLVPNSVRAVGNTFVENDIPILGTAQYSYYNHSTNTLMYENMVLDKTFLKLRELTLSYAIPKKFITRTPLKALEVSLVGRNLLMWTPKTNNFVDPEATNFGNDLLSDFGEFSAGPSSRFYGANVKITF